MQAGWGWKMIKDVPMETVREIVGAGGLDLK